MNASRAAKGARWSAALALLVVCSAPAARGAGAPPTVVHSLDAGRQERLAAREIRRYVYLRTGELAPLRQALPAEGDAVVVARKDRAILAALPLEAAQKRALAELGAQQYCLKTIVAGPRRVVLVAGGDDVGTLYAAYRLAEHLGVRFFLHGDVVPDEQVPWKPPALDEAGRPLFALRGVNPWGSHPFGFDLWSADDYKAHIGQLAKMRMNFIGMHCYPEGHPYAEPTVWLGLDGDFDASGRVKASYPSRYYNTLWRGRWGPILPKKTGAYRFGGRLLFERDAWGPDVMTGACPSPTTPEACNAVFNRTGEQFRRAFTFARLVGVKTCLGTEAPMVMPKALRERLKAHGKDPADPAAVQEVYEGIFRRIMRTHPLDYYWLWTPETWTWRGNSPEQTQAVADDVHLALAALVKVKAPFRLATCGWVLGPKGDRAAFDHLVPKRVPLSAISRVIGYEPLDPAFGRITGRPTWAIPWLESDDRLASPQLWVARTRKDAADALAYGCSGLMGLHWRTRAIGPNLAALARAGWDQSGWNPRPGTLLPNTLPGPSSSGPAAPPVQTGRGVPRGLPTDDFFADWAKAMFGPTVAERAATLFRQIDGRLPQSLGGGCPAGSLRPIHQPWQQLAKAYGFVDRLADLQAEVRGAGCLERFAYWLNTFRYLRSQAEVQCALGGFEGAIKTAEAEKDATRRSQLAAAHAVPAYRELLRRYGEMATYLLAAVTTKGGLAMVITLEQHARFRQAALDKPAARLAATLGRPLPDDLQPPEGYAGRPRLIVPTVRTSVAEGEVLRLEVIVLAADQPHDAALAWRKMGRGAFHDVPLEHVARGVYTVAFPPGGATSDLEYHVRATVAGGVLRFPPTAPCLNQTVVLLPR